MVIAPPGLFVKLIPTRGFRFAPRLKTKKHQIGRGQMKTLGFMIVIGFLLCLIIFGFFLCSDAFSQTDIAGAWEGKLAPAPDQKITIQFIITKQPDGSFKATVNSPDSGAIKNEPADSVTFKNGKLDLKIAKLSGSYSGALNNGVIAGQWKQPGGALPLTLARPQKPSTALLKPLMGQWVGKLKISEAMVYTVVLRFETAANGKFVSLMEIPEQGAQGDKAIPIETTLEQDQMAFEFPAAGIEYTGKLANNSITGVFKQASMNIALNFTKGKYTPPHSGVGLSPEDIKRLTGEWVGKLNVPSSNMTLTVVVRFVNA
jgi:hypothetical protein